MIGKATFKRTVKQTAGWAAVMSRAFSSASNKNACIFYYHRVAELGFVDNRVDDWNVTPAHFEKQIATLKSFAEVVPLIELPAKLARDNNPKPLVALTFDDGYANFHSQVLPVLKQYQVPATAFVVTGVIDSPVPMSFDHWARSNQQRSAADAWRPLKWRELEECVASGLVTVGAHSHRHLHGSQCSTAQIEDEVGHSREILQLRLGEAHSNQYAYPYGNSKLGDVSSVYIEAVKKSGFRLAVTTDLGLVNSSSDSFCLPRLEAHMMDSPGVLKAKALGALAPYKLTDHFRGAYRA